MSEELENLAKEFIAYRGDCKRKNFPEDLWRRSINLCEQYPVKVVANTIRVSVRALCRHYKPHRKKAGKTRIIKCSESPKFIPISIENQPSIQITLQGPIYLNIEFNRSTEELAKLLFAIQERAAC